MNDENSTRTTTETAASEAQATALKLWVVLARALTSVQAHCRRA